MLSRCALSAARRSATAAARTFSDAAAATSTVKLNFSLPHEKIYDGAAVHSVILPGSSGEYGITANHVPYVAQLKPGVVQILHEEGAGEPEKYFVAGGYALTHEDSSTVRVYCILLRARLLGLLPRMLLLFIRFYLFSNFLTHYRFSFWPCRAQDVVCPEAVKLDDIDSSAVSSQFDSAKSKFASAAAGSIEQAEAQIDMEVNRAMGLAVGLNLS